MTSSSTSSPWLMRALAVWACGAIFYCYQFALRVSPSVMADNLMCDFGVQGCALGALSAAYYYAYASLQIPVGMALDRIGARKIVATSILFCALGCLAFAGASSVFMASLGRFLMGAGSACAFIGSIKLITLWFPQRHVALMVGLTMMLGTFGATFGVVLLPRFFDAMGWRYSMILLGTAGAFFSIFSWFLLQKKNEDQRASEEKEPQKIGAGLMLAVRTPQIWCLALFGCLMYVPLSAFGDLWGVPFLTRVYGLGKSDAGLFISTLYCGVAVGSLVVSALSDRLKARRPLMRAGAFMSLLCYVMIVMVPVPSAVMMILLFVAGFAFGGQLLCFTAVTETLPLWASGVGVGVTNMTIMMSGVIFEPLVGQILDMLWDGTTQEGSPLYAIDHFRTALLPVALSVGGAFLLTFFIRETHPDHKKVS